MEVALSAANLSLEATQDQPRRQQHPPPATEAALRQGALQTAVTQVAALSPAVPPERAERAVLVHWVITARAMVARSAIIQVAKSGRLRMELDDEAYTLTSVDGGWAVIRGRDNAQLYRMEITESSHEIVRRKLGSTG